MAIVFSKILQLCGLYYNVLNVDLHNNIKDSFPAGPYRVRVFFWIRLELSI